MSRITSPGIWSSDPSPPGRKQKRGRGPKDNSFPRCRAFPSRAPTGADRQAIPRFCLTAAKRVTNDKIGKRCLLFFQGGEIDAAAKIGQRELNDPLVFQPPYPFQLFSIFIRPFHQLDGGFLPLAGPDENPRTLLHGLQPEQDYAKEERREARSKQSPGKKAPARD